MKPKVDWPGMGLFDTLFMILAARPAGRAGRPERDLQHSHKNLSTAVCAYNSGRRIMGLFGAGQRSSLKKHDGDGERKTPHPTAGLHMYAHTKEI